MEDSDALHQSDDLPQVTVLIENPSKSNNWGPLLRCCTAFGIQQIVAVGFDKCAVRGSHGASRHIDILAFHDHATALKTLKDEWGFTIVGVLQGAPDAYDSNGYQVQCSAKEGTGEMVVHVRHPGTLLENSAEAAMLSLPKSLPLHCRPFTKRTCLAVGKRAKGLSLSLAKVCDAFVHIPIQGLSDEAGDCESGGFGVDATWLSVEAGMSIVLHEFALWAGYGRQNKGSDGKIVHYQGQKYHVESKPKGEASNDERVRKQMEREAQREESVRDDNYLLGDVFGSTDQPRLLGDDAGDY